MSGSGRALARLFDVQGKLFVIALDHPQTFGVMPGLENPRQALERCASPHIDGFILNVGMSGLLGSGSLVRKKLILRTSLGGSMMASRFTNVHENIVSPQTAVDVGADAVLMMLVLGGEDHRSMQQVARDIDAYHRAGLPCVVEILADDFGRTNDLDIQMNGARIAAEIGADVVKAFYTPDFGKVVAGCPVPVILAGGPKGEDIQDVARKAVAAGVSGFAFGRNVFQHPEPAVLIAALDAILRRGQA
jgi:DhnA family fructose-bisphosphate aldolase class Ia